MIMRRALTVILLAAALSVLLSGCGSTGGENTENNAFFYESFDSEQKSAYDAFMRSVEDPFSGKEAEILSENGEIIAMPRDSLDLIYQGLLYDHPELFWLDRTYAYRPVTNGNDEEMADAVAVIPVAASEDELNKLKLAFDESSDSLLEGIDPKIGDGAAAEQIYERLIRHAAYRGEAADDPAFVLEHTAFGAIAGESAVCDGFALAYRYLLSKRGIPCLVIPGESSGMAHTWNTVYWDGCWHEADPAWDASLTDNGEREYFDLTTEEMNKDHKREAGGLSELIPVAGADSSNGLR